MGLAFVVVSDLCETPYMQEASKVSWDDLPVPGLRPSY